MKREMRGLMNESKKLMQGLFTFINHFLKYG